MLERMLAFHSVSGGEREFALWLKGQLEPYATEVRLDRVGNLIARKGANPQVAIFAHMDTVGYMVKRVDNDKGMVELSPVGKPRHAHGARALVLTQAAEIEGVLIEKDSTDSKDSEDKKVYVDTGLSAPGEVIHIGDLVTYAPCHSRHGDIVISRSLDDKLGCYVGMEVLKRTEQVTFVGTVGEECNHRGARAAAYAVQPDVALVVDITYDENIIEDYHITMGAGPAICLKDDLMPDRWIVERLREVARQRAVPLQFEVLDNGGSDAKAIYDVGEGISFVFIGIPIRYSHSSFEMAHMQDVENAIELICAFLEQYDRVLDGAGA